MIVDAHCHVARVMTGFWQPRRHGRAFDNGREFQCLPPPFDPTASPPDVLLAYMDDVGVDRAFLVQHHLYGNQNETVLECLRTWPDRFEGYAYLGAFDQSDPAAELERLIEAGMLGLKVEVASTRRLNPGFRFDGEREGRVWERLNRLRRPLALDLNGAPAEDTAAVRRMMDENEHVQVVICHVGGPVDDCWQERGLLAKHPRGWTDLAALQIWGGPGEEYPFPKAQEYVRWAVENIGADRVMWGTDYPPLLRHATYRQLLDFVRRHCPFLSDEQRADIIGGTAERYLKVAR